MEIIKYPLLGKVEEKEFILRTQNGDKEALEYLILCNIGMIKTIAKRFVSRTTEFEDLCQVGVMGLMKSIDKFDLSKNLKLSTYAHSWIRQHMIRLVQNHSRTIRVPCWIFDKNYKIDAMVKELESELGRKATSSEMVEYCDKTLEEITEFKKSMVEVCSFDLKVGETGSPIADAIKDEKAVDPIVEMAGKHMIKIIKTILSEKEFDIFSKKIGLKNEVMTCKEIAKTYNTTWKDINSIYRSGLIKLKKNQEIREYQYLEG
ncbi:MAG TPA: sigma-70 family RNA polymerase sigma factor [Clostridiaceae bacterium]